MEYRDEQRIEHHVCYARRDDDSKPDARAFGDDQKALEYVLQHIGGRKGNDDTSVKYAVLEHCFACAHELRDGADEGDAQNGQRNARDDDESDQHGEDAVCPFLLSASQLLGDERAAARADHEAHAAKDHDERHDEVQRGERCFTDIV